MPNIHGRKLLGFVAALVWSMISLTSCADWWAYNITTRPGQTYLIPKERLYDRSYAQSIEMSGWVPSFCRMKTAKEEMVKNGEFIIPDPDIPPSQPFKSIDHDNHELLKSYLRAIPKYMMSESYKGLDPEKITTVPTCPDPQDSDEFRRKAILNVLKEELLKRVDGDHDRLLLSKTPLQDFKKNIDEWKKQTSLQYRDHTLSTQYTAALSVSLKRSEDSEEKKPFFQELQSGGQQAIVDFAKLLVLQPDVPSKDRCKDAETEPDCIKTALKATGNLLSVLKSPVKTADEMEDFKSKQSVELTVSSIMNSPEIMNRFDYVTTYLYIYPFPYPPNAAVSLEKEFWRRVNSLQIARRKDERKQSLSADLERAWLDLQVKIDAVQTTVNLSPIQEIAQVKREAQQAITVSPSITGQSPTQPQAGTLSGQVGAVITSGLQTQVQEKIQKQLDQRSTWINDRRNLLRITQRGLDAINIAGTITEKITIEIPASRYDIPILEVKNGKIVIKKHLSQPVYSRVEARAVTLAVVRKPSYLRRSAVEKYGLPDSADSYLVVDVSSPIPLVVWQWQRRIGVLTLDDFVISPNPTPARRSPVLLRFFSPIGNRDDYASIDLKQAEAFLGEIKGALRKLLETEQMRLQALRRLAADHADVIDRLEQAGYKDPLKLSSVKPEVLVRKIKGLDKESVDQIIKEAKKLRDSAKKSLSLNVEPERRQKKYYLVSGGKSDIDKISIGKEDPQNPGQLAPFTCGDIPFFEEQYTQNNETLKQIIGC